MTPMTIQTAKRIIQANEGFRERMYLCTSGKRTIGYGHNLDASPISKQAATQILEDDIAWFVDNLPKHMPLFSKLCPVRQIVLIDMAFNLGLQGFLTFRRMFHALFREDYETAAAEILASRYAIQVGERAVRNSRMMRTGEI